MIRSFLPPFAVRRMSVVVAACSAALLVSSSAFADKPAPAPSGTPAPKPKFPMAGKEFGERVEKRLHNLHDRVEKRLAKGNAPDDAKKKARDAYTALATKVRAATAKATADGTVTTDEAKSVRKLFRQAKRAARSRHPKKSQG